MFVCCFTLMLQPIMFYSLAPGTLWFRHTIRQSGAHYPPWLELLALPADMRPFVDLFACRFGKVLIPNGWSNPFRANPRVCVEVDFKRKVPLVISMCTIDGVCQQKVRYLNLPNACEACQAQDHLIRDCSLHRPRSGEAGAGGSTTPVVSHGMASGGTLVASGQGVGSRGPSPVVGSRADGKKWILRADRTQSRPTGFRAKIELHSKGR